MIDRATPARSGGLMRIAYIASIPQMIPENPPATNRDPRESVTSADTAVTVLATMRPSVPMSSRGRRRYELVRVIAGIVTTTVPSAYALMKRPTVPSLTSMPSAMSGRSPAGMVSAAIRMNPMSASTISAASGRRGRTAAVSGRGVDAVVGATSSPSSARRGTPKAHATWRGIASDPRIQRMSGAQRAAVARRALVTMSSVAAHDASRRSASSDGLPGAAV